MEKLSTCPICGKPDFRHVQSCLDHTVSRETFSISECQGCGLWFTNPRPEVDEIGRYYESEDYISHSGKTKGLIGKAYRWARRFTIKRKVNLVLELGGNQKGLRLVDIGCGTGEFLFSAKAAGCVVVGIEPSLKAREYAINNYGLEVFPEDHISAIQTASVDIVTMWHVLEHVHSLKDRVEELRRVLVPNGTAIIAVPNRLSWDAEKYGAEWAAYDVPRHLYHFRREDIRQLFESNGFTLERTLPMQFDSFYVSMLSDKHRGKQNLIGSTWNGLVSNLRASTLKGTWSSQIYVIRKNG